MDDAISGTSTLGRRTFLEMIADAQKESHPFDFVIVYDVKRFGRVDNDEAGYYRHVLRTHGVEVCYVSENFNGDATDDLLRPVKQWQARQESKDLSKVTIRRRVQGEEHPTTLWSINQMGSLLNSMGRYAEAETHIRDALEGRRRVLGEEHPLTLKSIKLLIELYESGHNAEPGKGYDAKADEWRAKLRPETRD